MKFTMVCVTAVAGMVCCIGCSRDAREDLGERVEKLGQAIQSGGDRERDPHIVRELQRKERIRQDNEWTPENRARHPVEYCQAKLEDLRKHAQTLEGVVHEKLCKINALKREMENNAALETNLAKFIETAKQAYREGEQANRWPVQIGGFALSQETAKAKIIEAAQKLSGIRGKVATRSNILRALEKSLEKARGEQKVVSDTQEKLQNVISELKLKKVIDGDDGIKASLDAIGDSLDALGGSTADNPSLETLSSPDEKATQDALFKEIMSK